MIITFIKDILSLALTGVRKTQALTRQTCGVCYFYPSISRVLPDDGTVFRKHCIGRKANSRLLEIRGNIFYKFKLPEVQINLHFG